MERFNNWKTFESGNYNASYFITQFKNLLGTNDGWGITLDTINSKFTITNTFYSFTLSGDSSIDYVMGFNEMCSSTLVNSVHTLTLAKGGQGQFIRVVVK